VSDRDPIAAGTLKLITTNAPREIAALIEAALRDRIGAEELRCMGDGAFVAYCNAAPSEIRDWLAPLLNETDTLLVAEFERWSSRGPAVDARWLLRRGH
jgi:hypothetical protein